MTPKKLLVSLFVCVALIEGCSKQTMENRQSPLAAQIKQFAPTELCGDTSRLSEGDRKALAILFEVSKLVDRIYTRQVWSGNTWLRERLEADTSAEGKEGLHLYNIYYSPWSGLDSGKAFIHDPVDHRPIPSKRPEGADYYPEDMTKSEFESWLKSLPASEQKKATGFFHTIRRGKDGKLKTVPYSEEYYDLLEPASRLMRQAAGLTDNASLKKFLNLRAEAFLTNDYYASDVAWMELDSPIEPTIGPYEVYMDELFNYKAAFEAYITLRNDEETKKLELYSRHLQEIENNLPIDAKYRNPRLGALSPIRVVDEVMIGGEARSGVQTAAYNLPNDERITAEKGSKRVMLKNVQEAKFNSVLVRIAEKVLDADQRSKLAFEPFFTHILTHELMHGLGPHNITVAGKQTTVRQAMKDLSSAIEEAKADVSGLFALQFLMDKGIVDKSMEEPLYITYLAGVFRSVRFGINEAHGKGMALQFNYLLDEGAFEYNRQNGTFRVNLARIKDATKKLTSVILTLQAEGDYAGVKSLFDKYAVVRPEMKSVLASLTEIPVDIEPRFALTDKSR